MKLARARNAATVAADVVDVPAVAEVDVRAVAAAVAETAVAVAIVIAVDAVLAGNRTSLFLETQKIWPDYARQERPAIAFLRL